MLVRRLLFEYWHNIKLEQKSQAQSYNEVAQRHGDNSSQIETLLQWYTTEQLESSLLNIFNKRRIQKAIELLENLKFISVHRNPNPRYSLWREGTCNPLSSVLCASWRAHH